MRYAALSAAVFGGAMFLAPISPVQLISFEDFSNTNEKISVVAPQVSYDAGKKRAVPASQQQIAVVPPQVTVTVAPGDSLVKIAEAANTTYRRVYDANPDIANPNAVFPGQELRIPTADEVLVPRELPAPVIAAAPVRAQPSNTPAYTAPSVTSGSVWDRLAACESGGRWAVNTGNGYYGGLQFSLASWQAVGGVGMPNEASREEQILRGEILQQRGGWGNWPACTAKLGIR